MDFRTAIPLPFLASYPALISQSSIHEKINITSPNPSPRDNYNPTNPQPLTGPTKLLRLGDIVLGRSDDKGGNLNVGFFPRNPAHWPWLRSFMTRERMRELIGEDWEEGFFIERVEFEGIRAVHFVIYAILGRGVSSSSRLDGFGKGFVDYVRDKVVGVPVGLV
ncbi:hypothetical protein SI65_04526 [Aspergillus cristatus]|uniref:AtuA-like ferredoxin-fold domain-containing protein n=1 Tax=Aspergillus cristatus TaxID=573508 RepID=A0A1E3BF01_ASPCR|nr:hypothetical protein SI65_04526 [Aspergillus cristatus]